MKKYLFKSRYLMVFLLVLSLLIPSSTFAINDDKTVQKNTETTPVPATDPEPEPEPDPQPEPEPEPQPEPEPEPQPKPEPEPTPPDITQRDDENDSNNRVTTEVIKVEEIIAYATIYEDDPDMYVDETRVTTEGRNGLREVSYSVNYENGVEVSRIRLADTTTIREPRNEVVLRGTKLKDSEDPIPKIYLDSITIDGGVLDKVFNPEVLEYEIKLNDNVSTIIFNATSDNHDATIQGLGTIDAYKTDSHSIKISVNSENYTQYHFTWDNSNIEPPVEGKIFVFEGNVLEYDPSKTLTLRGINKSTIKVDDQVLDVYEDTTKGKMIALKNIEDVTSWYQIGDDNKVIKAIPQPFSGNGKIYHKVDFVEIDKSLLDEFNLKPQLLELVNLNGYAISKEGFEKVQLIRLGTLDEADAWYSIDSENSKITKLDFNENITKENLVAFFEAPVITTGVEVQDTNSRPLLLVASMVALIAIIGVGLFFFNRHRKNKMNK